MRQAHAAQDQTNEPLWKATAESHAQLHAALQKSQTKHSLRDSRMVMYTTLRALNAGRKARRVPNRVNELALWLQMPMKRMPANLAGHSAHNAATEIVADPAVVGVHRAPATNQAGCQGDKTHQPSVLVAPSRVNVTTATKLDIEPPTAGNKAHAEP